MSYHSTYGARLGGRACGLPLIEASLQGLAAVDRSPGNAPRAPWM